MPYLYDTDVISATLGRNPRALVIRRLADTPPEDQATSAITIGELLYGARRRQRTDLEQEVIELAERMSVVPFDAHAADVYGDLKSRLELVGQPLDEPDLRIAATALAYDLTLVTGNVRHFRRVPNLTIENWLEPQ